MRCRIENRLNILTQEVDFTKATDIEFYVKQDKLFFQYTPEVIDENNLMVVIPFDDAEKLAAGNKVILQYAFTDENGNKIASNTVTQVVQDLIKEEGYNPL